MSIDEEEYGIPYLRIEFETYNSQPKVIYKGREIRFKSNFKLEYDTEPMSGMAFDMTYHTKSKNENGTGLVRSVTDRTAGKWDYKRSD